MSKLGVVEDTLFVPMLGRSYASKHGPQVCGEKNKECPAAKQE